MGGPPKENVGLAAGDGVGPGSRVAGYLIEERAGRGGMAVVFRARDERLGRLVALKVLAPVLAEDAELRQRFIRESRAAAAVDDPHIIPVFEAGEADGVLFIAMRYVAGGDVRSLLRRSGPLPAWRAAAFLSPVASALDAAHRAGLVHRDVKSANMLVDTRPGRPDHVYLSDFGISKAAMSSVGLTGTGEFLGTPDYSAPEQIEGRVVNGRADQYSLACTAFELLTGTPPFPRDHDMAVIYAHTSEPPPLLTSRRPESPPAADGILAKAMAKDPADRYPSCQEFIDSLRAALGLAAYETNVATEDSGNQLTEDDSRGPAPGPPKPASPELALSDTVIDLGRLTQHGRSPEHRIRISNAGGGDLNAQATTTADWLKLRWVGDELAVAMDTSAAGEYEGTATIESEGGTATIRVHAQVDPRRAIQHRPVIIVTTAISISVIGLVIAITIISGPPGTSARWTYTTGGPVTSSPAVTGGTVYIGSADFGSADGKVYALDAATGHTRWTYTIGGPITSSPAVTGGTVYIGSDDHKVYALNAATGHTRWTYTTGGPIGFQFGETVSGGTVYIGNGSGTVYIGSADGKVYALDAATGHPRWTYTTGGPVVSRPAVTGGTVYIGSEDHKVYALDAATGHPRWTYTTGDAVTSSPAVTGGTVCIGSQDHKVYALDAATGHPRWTYTTGDDVISSPAVTGGTVYIGSDDNKVYALDAGS